MTHEALLSVVSNLMPTRAGVLKFKKGVKKVFKADWSRNIDEHDETNEEGYVSARRNNSRESAAGDENTLDISDHVDLVV